MEVKRIDVYVGRVLSREVYVTCVPRFKDDSATNMPLHVGILTTLPRYVC
jgi:hypothetical protein